MINRSDQTNHGIKKQTTLGVLTMRKSNPAIDILDAHPEEDQGSEAISGFDYQAHCITRLCVEMVCSHEIVETVCEYHEDLVQILRKKPPRFCQIKKRESSDAWTIDLIEDAIIKLFQKLKYKNVGELIIYGNGRPSQAGSHSLAGLIALLNRPKNERDKSWVSDLGHYERYLSSKFSSKLDSDSVSRGLRLLRIDLQMPHPEAIESENIVRTIEIIREVWGVEATLPIAKQAYDALFKGFGERAKNLNKLVRKSASLAIKRE